MSGVLIPFSPDIAAAYGLRILQGLLGGFAIPLLLTAALRVLTPETRLYGLGIYALTATLTPALAAPLAALWTEWVGCDGSPFSRPSRSAPSPSLAPGSGCRRTRWRTTGSGCWTGAG